MWYRNDKTQLTSAFNHTDDVAVPYLYILYYTPLLDIGPTVKYDGLIY